MRKIHVITQKEMVDPIRLEECTAVVIDVFLATSTIAFLIKNNYEPIYAMEDVKSARAFAAEQKEPYILIGEAKGQSIEGFIYPNPTLFRPSERQIPAIICSTNGTRAIERAKKAKALYVSSLVNGHLIAQRLHEQDDGSSIVLISSGNDNRFSMEDFVGAGQIIDHLMGKGEYLLSDSSIVARETYKHSKSTSFQNLLDSETATLLSGLNFSESMNLVIENYETVNVLPILSGNKIINAYANVQSLMD